nr:Lysophospholipase L2 [Raoultella sp. NCTC 9187]
MRFPDWMVRHILDWAEGYQRIREEYAIGTGRWRALPFSVNVLTHSRQRYRRNLRFYADEPQLRVGGPTYHWVREGILAGEEALAGVEKDITPRCCCRLKKNAWSTTVCTSATANSALRRATLRR